MTSNVLDIKNMKYNVSIEDMENMLKSGIPNETIEIKFIDNPIECIQRFKAKCTSGWWIRVSRKLYGEWYDHDSFVDHELVEYGPEWVEHHQVLIDEGFENARQELLQAKH